MLGNRKINDLKQIKNMTNETKQNHFGFDKWLHRICGFAIGAVVTGILIPDGVAVLTASAIGFAATVVAAFGKEFIYDKLIKKGNVDWYDILATVEGGLLGVGFGIPTGLN
jgi:hypothetical protein